MYFLRRTQKVESYPKHSGNGHYSWRTTLDTSIIRTRFAIIQSAVIKREIKIRPRPVDGFGKIDLARHVRELIDQTSPFDIKSTADFQDAAAFVYDLDILSENSDPVELAVQFTDQIAFNTILSRDEFLGYDQDDFRLLASDSRILINALAE